MIQPPQPFADLPAGLVEELLAKAGDAGEAMLASFQDLRDSRDELRKQLRDRNLVRHESELGYPPEPSTCGTDGSYGVERLLSADFVACAAVAVEGLTPPKEARHWPEPRFKTFVSIETHAEDTTTLVRSIMIGRELVLASEAPHDVVMVDGSMALPLIYLNQALNASASNADRGLARTFLAEIPDYLSSYLEVLSTRRTDKQYIALPKYTSRREIGNEVGWPMTRDDRGILSQVLEAGEYSDPRPLEPPEQQWHLNVGRLRKDVKDRIEPVVSDVVAALESTFVTYYKPHLWLPALRLEMSREIATNRHRLAVILRGLKHQCATSAMLEPYPIYLADRTVKALARALPAFRHIATQHVSESYEGDIADVFFAMHSYRSEAGA